MHKSDIEKLEDMLINQEKYRKLLLLRKLELQDNAGETIPESKQNNDLQDPRTIRAGSNTSSVESTVTKLHSDLRYRTLYLIVCNTPKFIDSLNQYEKIVYEYRYKRVSQIITEWDDIAVEVEKKAVEIEGRDATVGRTKTLNIRTAMLKRFADKIEYIMM